MTLQTHPHFDRAALAFEADLYSLTPWGVMGWARLPSKPGRPVNVEVVLDGEVIGHAVAADLRPDVAASGGEGICGFTLAFEQAIAADRPPSVRLRLDDEVGLLTGLDWSRLEGFVDEVTIWGATGWAWMPTSPAGIVTVEARVGARVVGRAAADHMRWDIDVSGRGTGRYGFVLRFEAPVGADELVTYEAIAPDGTRARLPSAPRSEVVGFVDALDRAGAVGWTWRPETPELPLAVEAVLDGVVIGRGVADGALDHLRRSGRGTGRYGFEISFDRPVTGDRAPMVQARFAERSFPLAGVASLDAAAPAGPVGGTMGAPGPEGAVDILTRHGASGWAWDPRAPDRAVVVEAVVDGLVVARAEAMEPRDDLAYWEKGTGRYGFTLAFEREVAAGAVKIVGRAGLESFELDRGGVPAEDAGVPAVGVDGDGPAVEGSVDHLSRSGATGWAWLPGAPEAAVTVRAVLGGRVVGAAVADLLRGDLAEWGKGTGRYGFRLGFEEALSGEIAPAFEVAGAFGVVTLPAPPLPVEASPTEGGASEGRASTVEGHVDRLTRWEASGWAWMPGAPRAAVEVCAVLEGRIIGRAVADQLRQDLADWGKGTGLYGYHMVFDAPVTGETAPVLVPYVPAGRLECELALPGASGSEAAARPRGTIEMLLAEHGAFTVAGPQFEEFDGSILADATVGDAGAAPWLIAFYLPQFHAIEANDRFWGKGFTEWRQLPRGISRYPGHYQPRTPRDLGFYNLLDIAALERQFALARAAGITAFAYYYYWFNGTRVLERPLENLLASEIDVPFMIIWANENWTRTWDGSESSILLRQDYRKADDRALVADLARHFRDERYLRVGGRPLFVIYNPSNIPDAARAIGRWRKLLRSRHGFDPLIFMAQSFGMRDPGRFRLDGGMEFPPHKLSDALPGRRAPDAYSADFGGRVIGYEDFVGASLGEARQEFPLVKTVAPSWDNESRRPNRGLSLEGASPRLYEGWLRALLVKAMREPVLGQAIVAVNAWNEWAEGAYLEPDVYFGAAYLNATARARRSAMGLLSAEASGRPRVSVILPNYNHEAFIVERIVSLLQQSVPPDEIIFLDDCSSDDSVALARATLEAAGIPFRVVLNTENSGCVFRQWVKGLALARHELIWIAETDDSADPDFLLHILPQFEREDVAAAFGHMRYIDADGTRLDELEGYFDDLRDFAWNRSAVVPAYRAFARDFTVKNVIPNASGLVFRKPRLTAAEAARLVEYRFAGDWYFYALVLRGGSVAYCRAAESYFRLSRSGASRSALFTERHLAEHAMIARDLRHLYGVGQAAIAAHAASLARYLTDRPAAELEALLGSGPAGDGRSRPLRICIAVHSFDVGGGELMPLELANALRDAGHHVTYLAVERARRGKPSLRQRLRADVPVVYWEDVKADFGGFLAEYGIEVLNSHNVGVDYRLALTQQAFEIPYVASLHGGYETVPEILTEAFYGYVARAVTRWLFLSEKNLIPLKQNGVSAATFKRSFNAVADFRGEWVDRAGFRAEHGIPEDAFVLIQCSRAIEEKGWGVAADVVAEVARRTGRDVRLVLIGEGPAADRLRAAAAAGMRHVTLLGAVDTPMRYFRCCDAAIFPTIFSGETFPLFLLEAFMAGLPVISTDIGEIEQIMGAEKARRPGVTVGHRQSPAEMVASMAKELARLVTNARTRKSMRKNAYETSARFSMSELTRYYVDEFRDIIAERG